MDWSSWFRRALLKDNIKATTADPSKANDPPPSSKRQSRLKKSDLEEHGITYKLVDLVRTFTVDTFKSFPLQDDGDEPGRDVETGATAAETAKRDLSDWQERHASLVLARVKELAQLRYVLCPRQMKEHLFWEIYFMLSHVAKHRKGMVLKWRCLNPCLQPPKNPLYENADFWIIQLEQARPSVMLWRLLTWAFAALISNMHTTPLEEINK